MTNRYLQLFAVIVLAGVLTLAGCANRPVATVGGVKITEQEVNERLVQAFGEQVLRSMIDRQLLQMAAKDKGVEVTEEELAEAVEEAKAQYGSEEQFQQFLAQNNLSEEQWKDEVRIMVLAKELALHGINPTEEQLREFYQEHKDRFGEPAMVSLSEIVVSSKEEAEEVLQEIEAGDASFADLASRYSLSGTRESGGERPPMPIEQIQQPEIKEVAQNLPVGEVSQPIEAGGSWLILKIRDRTQAREPSFEQDREQIVEEYKRANANSLDEIIKEQINKTNINIVDPRFQGLNEVYSTMPDEIPQFGAEDAQQDGAGQPAPQPVPDAPELPDAPDAPAAPDAPDAQ